MDDCTILTGDFLRIVRDLPRVDAVVTDPPYGVNAVKKGKTYGFSNRAETKTYRPIIGDDRPFDPRPLLALAKVQCLFGANYYAHLLPPSSGWLVWDKRDGTRSNTMADCEMAWTTNTTPARMLSHRWMGMIRASERGERLHPAQKPVAVMRWAIGELKLPKGAIILDPYCGSASTGVACRQLGYRFIGVEIDDAYARLGRARLAACTIPPA